MSKSASAPIISTSTSSDESKYRELDPNDQDSSPGSSETEEIPSKTAISRNQWITVAILTFVNLINYMDRYTIASILRMVQDEYQMNDSQAGALQTAFVISYMVFAPVFGYLGDRHSRKMIMAFGITTWVAATVVGSFMTDYRSFLVMRAIVGIGEASYSTIAPTIISDLFVKKQRSKMLAIFYFAIPVGSGLGYVVGRLLATAFNGDWHWALRGTPILGVIAVILILWVMDEPPRGEAEGHNHLKATDYRKDLKSLATNPSFVFSTLGFTCVTFCTGALAWWAPKYIEDAILSMNLPEEERPVSIESVSIVFGSIAMVAGMLGVPVGALLSTKLMKKFPRSDPLICGIGLIFSSAFILVAFRLANVDVYFCFALMLLGEMALNLNWSIVADILLYVVVPTRRGSAEAIQILISHLLGDAGSPYLIGVISESLKSSPTFSNGTFCSEFIRGQSINQTLTSIPDPELCASIISYHTMQYALMGNIIIQVMGGIFFFVTALFVLKDKLKVQQFLDKHSTDNMEERDFMVDKTAFNDTNDEKLQAYPELECLKPANSTVMSSVALIPVIQNEKVCCV